MSVLKSGSGGGSVEQLQQQLQDLGYTVEVDGKFGPITEAAVRAFQQKMGLTADGIAGPNTLTRLQQLAASGMGQHGGGGVDSAAEKARMMAEQNAGKGYGGNKGAAAPGKGFEGNAGGKGSAGNKNQA